MKPKKRLAVVILDGWGHAPPGLGNAIFKAATPTFDRLVEMGSLSLLEASGPAVGLPHNVPGNSQVGHIALGSGRAPEADITLLDKAIASGEFQTNVALRDAFERAKGMGSNVHLVGLVSGGGAHSHLRHLEALLEMAANLGVTDRTFVHAVTDGRDVGPRQASIDLPKLEKDGAQFASAMGRTFAMDRSGRFELTDAAVDIILGRGGSRSEGDVTTALTTAYGRGEDDQTLSPTALSGPRVEESDEVILFNFRPDGLRQLAERLCDSVANLTTLTTYAGGHATMVAFPRSPIPGVFAQVCSSAGLRQVHIAEQEKFRHVTYFFDGYRDEPCDGEVWIAVPSRRDIQSVVEAPDMSLREVVEAAVREIRSMESDVVILNFANVDTIGHTGRMSAVVSAAEAVDRGLADLSAAARETGTVLLLVADHGNGEAMLGQDELTPLTTHTTNPVPCLLVGLEGTLKEHGTLSDVAPTCLDVLGLHADERMTGRSLLA